MRLPRRRVVLILAASTALPFGAVVAVSSANQGPPQAAAPHRSPTVPPQVLPYHHAPAELTPVPHVHRQPNTVDPPGPRGPSGPRTHP